MTIQVELNNLTNLIGLPPSLMEDTALFARIRAEHQRVSQGILEPRTYKGKKVKVAKEPKEPKEKRITLKAKASTATEIEALLGVSLEELLAKEKEE